jgi:phosphoribosylglycinamide formyltransferase 1
VPTPVPPARLAVLVSGSGTNLGALLDAIDGDAAFGAEVVVVGADRDDAGGLRRAEDRGIPTLARPLAPGDDRGAWEARLRADVQAHDVDVVVLAGFMRILTAAFLDAWPQRVVNTHPSLLPAFRGARAVEEALAHGVKVTGCTVHLVDEEVDHGPIIAQEPVRVAADDTAESLHARIKDVEHRLLPASVAALCQGRLDVDGRHVRWRDPVPPSRQEHA